MNLYIWTEYCPDYYGGLAFAIAKNENDARKLVEIERGFPVSNWGVLEIRPLNKPIARQLEGGA